MPNWCTNDVQMKDIAKKKLYEKQGDKICFDFNKLIPMPESLNIEKSGREEIAITCFITDKGMIRPDDLETDKKELLFTDKDGMNTKLFGLESYHAKIMQEYEQIKNLSEEEKNELYALGEQYLSNYQKYRATTWYDWRFINWNTKWNARCTHIESDNEIRFDTAWAPPVPVLVKMSKKYHAPVFFTYQIELSTIGAMLVNDGVIIDSLQSSLANKIDEKSRGNMFYIAEDDEKRLAAMGEKYREFTA